MLPSHYTEPFRRMLTRLALDLAVFPPVLLNSPGFYPIRGFNSDDNEASTKALRLALKTPLTLETLPTEQWIRRVDSLSIARMPSTTAIKTLVWFGGNVSL